MHFIKEKDSYKSGYNSTIGGEGSKGLKLSDEVKQHLSEIAKEREFNPMFGKHHTDETKAKMSKKASKAVNQFSKTGEFIKE